MFEETETDLLELTEEEDDDDTPYFEKYFQTLYKIVKFLIQFVCKLLIKLDIHVVFYFYLRGHHGLDRMVVGFTTTYAISGYHH